MQAKAANLLHKFSFGAGRPVFRRGNQCACGGVELCVDPFLGTEALTAGTVTRHELVARYEAVYRDVYVPRGQTLTPAQRAYAAWLWSRRQATIVGVSAAAVHGCKWIDARLPAEVNQSSQHRTRGIVLHNDTLAPEEIVVRRGIPVTTPARTAFDLGRRYGRTLAVIRVDALLQAADFKLTDVDDLVSRHRGARGVVQLRDVIRLADDGAESPQETRTRLVLTDAGLRPTRTQINVCNDLGEYVRRIDMGWPEWKVGVEYDGEQHWMDPVIRGRDIDQQAELAVLGWRIVRVSAEILRYRPHTIVERTRAALQAAGAVL